MKKVALASLILILIGLMGMTAFAIDLMPKLGGGGPTPNGLICPYWLMSEGSQVGYRVKVVINEQTIATIKKPGETMEVSSYLRRGLNTIKFTAIDDERRASKVAPNSVLNIIIGPEYKRTPVGAFGNYTIELREKTVHYMRTAVHRAGESVVEMRFTLNDNPNPAKLQRKYVLYSDGRFTGHMIQVSVNGVPVVDIMSPDFHCDLNPFLVKGANEISFNSIVLDGYPFTASDREVFKEDDGIEVGIGVAGEFDPVTFDEPVRQLMKTNQRFTQSGARDQAEPGEKVTLMAE